MTNSAARGLIQAAATTETGRQILKDLYGPRALQMTARCTDKQARLIALAIARELTRRYHI